MTQELPKENIAMQSLVKADGELELFLSRQPMPEPAAGEVVVKVLAAPINPSDLLLLLAGADMEAARTSRRDDLPVVTAPIPSETMRGLSGRVGRAMPVGSEGSGIVVKASPEAQALLGKTVAAPAGGMYAQYRAVPAAICMVLPDGTDARDGASAFVNPMTVLGFVETMKREGHKAIVHTAAASNLGQMLNRVCIADGIPLVNIVRKAGQVSLLKGQGAQHVLDSTGESFGADLRQAIAETGATVVFDAIGGGDLAARILGDIEAVAAERMKEYNRYGSPVFKQLYIYGALDRSPTVFTRGDLGFKWSISGWLLPHFLASSDPETVKRMHARVAAELSTTFASEYRDEIPLGQALDLDTIAAYDAKRTGGKYLVTP